MKKLYSTMHFGFSYISTSFLLVISLQGYAIDKYPVIYINQKADKTEELAAREVRKYIYQRSGELLSITEWKGNRSIKGDAIIIGDLSELIKLNKYKVPKLEQDAYILKTISSPEDKKLLIYGGSPIGTLYGAYHFAEQLGIGFFLDGDVIPDKQVPFVLPDLDIKQIPLFNVRGILPFHDFPEGPDWWSDDDYKAIIAQLPKLGMNFIGFHSYPEGGVGPEPMVWIGPSWDIGKNGTIKSGYSSRHYNTLEGEGAWGYEPMNTSEYHFGASQMFEKDVFGAKYMMEVRQPKSESFVQQNELFNSFGTVLADAFTFAKNIWVKTCIGTETPLTIPKQVKRRLSSLGKDPKDPKTVKEVYEGIFQRIKDTHLLDYYWFWTPESWTLSGVNQSYVDTTISDLRSAIAAAKAVNAPFTLATSGWVLGPPQDRTLFDHLFPINMPLSAINREVGWTPVEPGFAKVNGRPKWAIPWLEDDPAIIIPQLWAGRMRRDAADALAYGCTGLIGIHWRTRILGPNVTALAQAAWTQDGWNPEYRNSGNPFPNSEPSLKKYESGSKSRDLPVRIFYNNWAQIQFGREISNRIGDIFSRLDGSKFNPKDRKANLPRPSDWVDGPGGINPDKRPWDDVRREYLFVDTLEYFHSQVKGQGNQERFDYWLNQFKYLREIGHLNCIWFQFNKVMKDIQESNNQKIQRTTACDKAIHLRIEMINVLTEVQNYLISSITTYGGLGNVTNWQQHIIPRLIREPNLQLEEYLGSELPKEATLPNVYSGVSHMFVPTVRTILKKGESLNLKVITISADNAKPVEEMIYWRTLGDKHFKSQQLNHVARGVYESKISAQEISDKGLEYHVLVKFKNGDIKRFPATAPDINQIVTLMPE